MSLAIRCIKFIRKRITFLREENCKRNSGAQLTLVLCAVVKLIWVIGSSAQIPTDIKCRWEVLFLLGD